MVSLSELASLVMSVYTALSQACYYILMLSYLIGEKLVNLLTQIGDRLGDLYTQISTFVQILFEDYSVFLDDVCGKILVLINVVQDILNFVIQIFVFGVLSIKSCLVYISDTFVSAGSVLKLWILNVGTVFSETMGMIKNFFLVLGSSIWLILTLIPLSIMYCTNLVYQFFVNILHELYTLYLLIVNTVMYTTNSVISYFFDVPLDSVIGLFVGVIFILFTIRNFKNIIFFLGRQSVNLYLQLGLITNTLWTGQFLPTTPVARNEITEVREEILDEQVTPTVKAEDFGDYVKDSNRCIICQDRTKDVILFPCKHVCMCDICSRQVRRLNGSCPLCRAVVRRTMKVYI